MNTQPATTKFIAAALALLSIPALTPSASAVVCIGPRIPVTPADLLVGGVAQYVGRFGNYTGVPISPRHFVTASHVGNNGGGFFNYNNGTATQTTYTYTLAGVDEDLSVYQLNAGQPSFTLWAPIYTRSNEVGKPLVVLGRGRDKGAELTQSGNLLGWFWPSTDDFLLTRGTNTVSQAAFFNGPPGFIGHYLLFTFDQSAGPTEATAALNDSTGPIFITDPADGVTKLAATISAVDGGYSTTANGPQFSGAFFDTRGLFIGGSLITGPNPIPIKAYAARLSQRLEFLRNTAGVPPLPCPADLNADRVIDTNDLVRFLGAFGTTVVPGAPGDINEDGQINTADLTTFLGAFGTRCP